MIFIGKLLKPFNPNYMKNYWTTWFGYVYAPNYFDLDDEESWQYYKDVLEHEKIHLNDQEKYGLWFTLTYLLPYGRWVWERKAYLPELTKLYKTDIIHFEERLETIATALGGPNYFWAWYKPWIVKWFRKKCQEN